MHCFFTRAWGHIGPTGQGQLTVSSAEFCCLSYCPLAFGLLSLAVGVWFRVWEVPCIHFLLQPLVPCSALPSGGNSVSLTTHRSLPLEALSTSSFPCRPGHWNYKGMVAYIHQQSHLQLLWHWHHLHPTPGSCYCFSGLSPPYPLTCVPASHFSDSMTPSFILKVTSLKHTFDWVTGAGSLLPTELILCVCLELHRSHISLSSVHFPVICYTSSRMAKFSYLLDALLHSVLPVCTFPAPPFL